MTKSMLGYSIVLKTIMKVLKDFSRLGRYNNKTLLFFLPLWVIHVYFWVRYCINLIFC